MITEHTIGDLKLHPMGECSVHITPGLRILLRLLRVFSSLSHHQLQWENREMKELSWTAGGGENGRKGGGNVLRVERRGGGAGEG